MAHRQTAQRLNRLFLVLAGIVVVGVAALALGMAATRWAYHVLAVVWITLATVGGLLLLAVLAKMLGGISPRTILELDLEQPVGDSPSSPLEGFTSGPRETLHDVIEALDRGARDKRVVALFARIGAGVLGLGDFQELRDAILAFRAAGKFALAFSETFGEGTPANGAYYLATAFDEIVLQPSGDVGLTGLMLSNLYIKGALDKLGIVARMDHRKEFKAALYTLTETEMPAPQRDNMTRLAASQFDQIVRGISERRAITEDEVRALADRGPSLAREALEARLVDKLAYRDEAITGVKTRVGGGDLLYLSRYRKRTRRRPRGATVAVVKATGGIRRGKSGGIDPLSMSPWMGSETVASALRAAVADKRVKAIVLRVDSPGGSAVASDTIWHETKAAKAAGKPVIVSMGNVAASGGYWISMAADKIVAHPGTITGSIGVLSGKMLTAGLREKLGLGLGEVHTSANARMAHGAFDYSPAEWDRLETSLDRIYSDFTANVADGRRLGLEAVEESAKGQVFTGEDAKARGLVDELGGYPMALRLAREAIGTPENAAVRIKAFPKQASPLRRVRPRQGDSSEDLAASVAPWVVPDLLGALGPSLAATLRSVDAGALMLPWIRITP